MMTQKSEKKALSKSILEMKFMKKSKEKYKQQQDDEEGKAMFASEVTEAMRVGGEKFIIEPSYVFCEGLIGGRLSYHGMNPYIEKLEQTESNKEKVDENNEMEINDMEMARRYTTLIGDEGSSDPNACVIQIHAVMPNYYDILGCDKTASYEEIKERYREQIKKCHPDKSKERSEEEFFELDKAWKTLRNPDSRREYDLEIGKNSVDEMPLYCEIELSDMYYNTNTDTYLYTCRCGGLYSLNKSELGNVERVKVPCEECTFHIDIFLSK